MVPGGTLCRLHFWQLCPAAGWSVGSVRISFFMVDGTQSLFFHTSRPSGILQAIYGIVCIHQVYLQQSFFCSGVNTKNIVLLCNHLLAGFSNVLLWFQYVSWGCFWRLDSEGLSSRLRQSLILFPLVMNDIKVKFAEFKCRINFLIF